MKPFIAKYQLQHSRTYGRLYERSGRGCNQISQKRQGIRIRQHYGTDDIGCQRRLRRCPPLFIPENISRRKLSR